MKEQNKLEVYNSMPVSQAVVRNAIPAMAAMLMTLIYNLADTFFIGHVLFRNFSPVPIRRIMLFSLPLYRLQAPSF